jgi:pantetheine-phosphate adenylyltransferase
MAAAIYPGTFDPFTYGHLDIVERACRVFGSVVVAVSQNPSKTPLFPLEERIAMVKESVEGIPGASVESFDGLLVDHARRTGTSVLIKGVRAPSDVEYETQMAQMNAALANVETVFLVATPSQGFISSSLVREVARLGGDIAAFVPPNVARRLKERFPRG